MTGADHGDEARDRESIGDESDRPGGGEDAYADWTPPGQDDERVGGEAAGGDGNTAEEMPVPPEVREPLLRDRVRDRLGLSARQWYVVESFLLVLPYPLFVLVYLTIDVNETLFLLLTGLYSLVAMYVGFLS